MSLVGIYSLGNIIILTFLIIHSSDVVIDMFSYASTHTDTVSSDFFLMGGA